MKPLTNDSVAISAGSDNDDNGMKPLTNDSVTISAGSDNDDNGMKPLTNDSVTTIGECCNIENRMKISANGKVYNIHDGQILHDSEKGSTMNTNEMGGCSKDGISIKPDTKLVIGHDKLSCNSNCPEDDTTNNGQAEKPVELTTVESSTSTCSEKVIQYFDYRLLANVECASVSILVCGITMTLGIWDTHFAGFAKEKGLSTLRLSSLMMILGVLSIIIRLLLGFIFDQPLMRRLRVYIHGVCYVIVGILLLILPSASSMVLVYILCMMYGLLDPILTVQNTVVLSDLVPAESYRSALGIQRFFRGIGVIVGPTFGGELH